MKLFKCWKCGQEDHLGIAALVWARLIQHGPNRDQASDFETEVEDGDHEWDDDSGMRCGACGYTGKVVDFKKEDK
jgi:hypothetical protein